MNYLDLVLNYFSGFAANDIDQISRHFSDQITLDDWEGKWEGKENVSSAIKDILDSNRVFIVPENISFSSSGIIEKAFCEIRIYLYPGEEFLKVIDIIEIETVADSIISIKAYKQ